MFISLLLLQRSKHFSSKLLLWGNVCISRVPFHFGKNPELVCVIGYFSRERFPAHLMSDLIGHLKVIFVEKQILSQ